MSVSPVQQTWQNTGMAIFVRASELSEIAPMRETYRREMNCQIIHDSIHMRAGWSREIAIELEDGLAIGYGSVAVGGPWTNKPALYEFFIEREHRMLMFEAFTHLLETCGASTIETQSNDALLAAMLHVFGNDVRAEAILFEDAFETSLRPAGAGFRAAVAEDAALLRELKLDEDAKWVVTLDGGIVGAGGVLYHYNRPYGDVYMAIAESFRRRGLGAYLVQELKAVCRTAGSVPSARCNVGNGASRKTLQKAGFVPCGALVAADV